jgi:hypothetical protein
VLSKEAVCIPEKKQKTALAIVKDRIERDRFLAKRRNAGS